MDGDPPRFEEHTKPPTQPGYAFLPALAVLLAILSVPVVVIPGLFEGSGPGPTVVTVVVAVWVVALATFPPAYACRPYTVVVDGTLVRGVAPESLAPGDPTTVPVEEIDRCEVVEAPLSDPPTDEDGDPLEGFGIPGRTGWPVGRGRIPDLPGVLVELEDGNRPRFAAVLPGEGIEGVSTMGRGPPGYLPSERPAELVDAVEAAREDETGSVDRDPDLETG